MIRTIGFLVIASAALFACTKSDPPAGAAASASITASVAASAPPPMASSAAPAMASAAPEASASAAAMATPAGSGSAGAAADCGSKEKPCPLQGWMRENANPPMTAGDMPALATALDKIVAFAPPGYTNWASISKDGAAAARKGDKEAAKASCRTCHDQYKNKYKAEMRARKI